MAPSLTLAFILGGALAGCGREARPVPAAGPLESRVTSVDAADPNVMRRGARIIRTIDELGDRKMAQATVATLAAQDEEVRSYASELLDDYRRLREREAKLGVKLGFVALKGDKAEAFEHRVHTEVLSLMQHSGADFDRMFLQRMVTEHEAALTLVESRLFGEAPLPELRENLEHDVVRLLRRNLERARELAASLAARTE